MKNYQGESSEEIAIERWENEGGEVKPLPEMRTYDNKILICVACFAVFPLIYWLVKGLADELNTNVLHRYAFYLTASRLNFAPEKISIPKASQKYLPMKQTPKNLTTYYLN